MTTITHAQSIEPFLEQIDDEIKRVVKMNVKHQNEREIVRLHLLRWNRMFKTAFKMFRSMINSLDKKNAKRKLVKEVNLLMSKWCKYTKDKLNKVKITDTVASYERRLLNEELSERIHLFQQMKGLHHSAIS